MFCIKNEYDVVWFYVFALHRGLFWGLYLLWTDKKSFGFKIFAIKKARFAHM